MSKIYCPICHRVLGGTTKSLDCNLNCRWCKKPVTVKMIMATTNDYFKYKEEND